jgi:hypothetical protein
MERRLIEMQSFRRQITFYLVIALLIFVAMKLLFNTGAPPAHICGDEAPV